MKFTNEKWEFSNVAEICCYIWDVILTVMPIIYPNSPMFSQAILKCSRNLLLHLILREMKALIMPTQLTISDCLVDLSMESRSNRDWIQWLCFIINQPLLLALCNKNIVPESPDFNQTHCGEMVISRQMLLSKALYSSKTDCRTFLERLHKANASRGKLIRTVTCCCNEDAAKLNRHMALRALWPNSQPTCFGGILSKLIPSCTKRKVVDILSVPAGRRP
jgi:hypothetical protein